LGTAGVFPSTCRFARSLLRSLASDVGMAADREAFAEDLGEMPAGARAALTEAGTSPHEEETLVECEGCIRCVPAGGVFFCKACPLGFCSPSCRTQHTCHHDRGDRIGKLEDTSDEEEELPATDLDRQCPYLCCSCGAELCYWLAGHGGFHNHRCWPCHEGLAGLRRHLTSVAEGVAGTTEVARGVGDTALRGGGGGLHQAMGRGLAFLRGLPPPPSESLGGLAPIASRKVPLAAQEETRSADSTGSATATIRERCCGFVEVSASVGEECDGWLKRCMGHSCRMRHGTCYKHSLHGLCLCCSRAARIAIVGADSELDATRAE
jgi:hypothetical protein